MIYEVEFNDGTTAQVNASNDYSAMRIAVAKYKDKLVVGVRKAGLMGMSQRRPPTEAGKA
ncbi:MAG TPA: hypothetical protein VEF07_04205 [Candidatus Binataceae bacterium]|nr:hypothetical protein [Candidatus Binataceae bacterium]